MSLFALPRSQTLPALTVQALKSGLDQGRWSIKLPGERDLARELQVSRAIVRSALRILEREGVIRKSARRKSHIVKRMNRGSKKRATVLFLYPSWDSSISFAPIIHYLHQVVQKVGLLPLNQAIPVLGKPGTRTFLQKVTARESVACWILMATSRPVQRYFEERKLSTLIVGHRHPGVSLPSIDLDNRAIARHAAGLLLARGHRRLGLIMYWRATAGAGDKATLRGFQEALAFHHPSPEIEVTTSEIRPHEKLDQLFRHKNHPTGLLVMHPFSVVGVFSHLYLRGFRIPEDVSVISFLEHPVFKSLPISVAHYSTASFFRQVATALMRQVGRASPIGKEILIESDFVQGKSLAGPAGR